MIYRFHTTILFFALSISLFSLAETGHEKGGNRSNKSNSRNEAAPVENLQAEAADAPLFPEKFRIHQHFFTFPRAKFTIQDENGKGNLGTVSEEFFTLTTTIDLYDPKGKLLANAKERFFALGSVVDVYDEKGKKIGTIKEKILKSLFKVSTEYAILDANGNEIATSEKLALFSTNFTIKDKKGRIVAEMSRPFFNLVTDNWNVKTSNNHSVDPRIVPLIPVFKTIADDQRRKESK